MGQAAFDVGLPKPDRRPPGVTGFSQYDKLYADVERWLQEGWLDYLVPQLYWPIERTAIDRDNDQITAKLNGESEQTPLSPPPAR